MRELVATKSKTRSKQRARVECADGKANLKPAGVFSQTSCESFVRQEHLLELQHLRLPTETRINPVGPHHCSPFLSPFLFPFPVLFAAFPSPPFPSFDAVSHLGSLALPLSCLFLLLHRPPTVAAPSKRRVRSQGHVGRAVGHVLLPSIPGHQG